MKKLTQLAAVGSAFILVFCLTVAVAQVSQTPPTESKTYQGELTKVDAAAKTITVKGSDDKQMMFVYDAQTVISGADSPQGLTGKTGSPLTITYHENRGVNMATKIEVREKPKA